jgi:AraC family transcriptional regulator
MTPDDPVLTSAGIGWQGFLLEQHVAKPPFEAPEHQSSKHILHFHTSPMATHWRIDGHTRHTTEQPGSVSVIPAGSRVAAIITGKGRATALALEIDPSYMESVAQGVGSGRRIELAERLAVRDRQIELLMNAMQSDLEAGSPAGLPYGEALGNALATYLIRRFSVFAPKVEEYKGGLPKTRLNRVLEYIELHLHDNISLTALAETAGISMYHFAKAFKQSTGATAHQYILERKIKRAKELLRDPRTSVLEASVQTCFVDQSHFTKTFRRLVGATPTLFRSQI